MLHRVYIRNEVFSIGPKVDPRHSPLLISLFLALCLLFYHSVLRPRCTFYVFDASVIKVHILSYVASKTSTSWSKQDR
jgi:hypothetical protein